MLNIEERLNTLPVRKGQRPKTRKAIPHLQIGIQPDMQISEELLHWLDALPDTVNTSATSLADVHAVRMLKRRTDIQGLALPPTGEFMHIHKDGSLHVTLPPDRAEEAIEAGWGERHPLGHLIGNADLVLLYTPRTEQELDVVFSLAVDSYNYVSGQALTSDEVLRTAYGYDNKP